MWGSAAAHSTTQHSTETAHKTLATAAGRKEDNVPLNWNMVVIARRLLSSGERGARERACRGISLLFPKRTDRQLRCGPAASFSRESPVMLQDRRTRFVRQQSYGVRVGAPVTGAHLSHCRINFHTFHTFTSPAHRHTATPPYEYPSVRPRPSLAIARESQAYALSPPRAPSCAWPAETAVLLFPACRRLPRFKCVRIITQSGT